MLNADLANTTTARAFVQVTRVTDQQSLVALISLAQQRPADFYDEAPLVRCLLLWQLFAQAEDYRAIHERAVTEVAHNARSAPIHCFWTPHNDHEDGQVKSGRAENISNICVTTITEYQVMQSGDLNGNVGMPDPNVIVPVRQEWSGQDWLVPYILSFTTTGWWNHSVSATSQMLNVNDGAPMGQWLLRFLPQACLPVIEGQHERIMLVCVNKTGENKDTQRFVIPGQHGDLELQYGHTEANFAEHVYTWLGVDVEAPAAVVNMSNEMSAAWAHLIETVAVEGVVTKAIATAAELSRTRWNGRLVKTGLEINDNDHHGILMPPYSCGPVEANVNGEPLVDITERAANWADANPIISVLTEWRSTPLCQMHKSVMYLGDGPGHQGNVPHAAGWSEFSPEYSLTESYHVNRVLLARDIFQHSPSVTKYRFRTTRSLMVFLSETATLIGSVANWMYCYYGMSLTGINRLYPMDRNVPHQQHTIISKATNSLVIPSFGQKWEPYIARNLLNDLFVVMNRNDFRYSSWKSLPLPWWLIEAVSTKFGLTYKINKKPDEVCVRDEDDDDWRIGYAVDVNTMWATTSILTADDRYIDNARYPILAYKSHGYDLNTWLAWNTDLYYDSLVNVQCAAAGATSVIQNRVQVNLLCAPFIQDNTLRDTVGPIYFISASSPNSHHAWMKCEQPLRYPDPIKDHLVGVGKTVIPELVASNVPGAIRAAVSSAADPAINWTLNKLSDVSDTLQLASREYLSPYGFPFNTLDYARTININYILRAKANAKSFKAIGLKQVFNDIDELYKQASSDPSSILMENYKDTTLMKLRRARTAPSYQLLKKQDLKAGNDIFDPFNLPLNFHFHWLSRLDCVPIREVVMNIMAATVSRIYTHRIHIDEKYRHDFTRQCLALLDRLTFTWSNEEETSSVGSLLHGLNNIGGPRGWKEKDLIDKCTQWVQGETTLGRDKEQRQFIESKIDTWVSEWVTQATSDKLPFDEYVTDPMKWGTSGGAPAKNIASAQGHEKVRSKWAWALSNLSEGKDIYKEAMSEKQTCSVALKEEAKTRLVITTPMSAYLRQSYIWYRLGKPSFLKSTLTDPGLLNTLASTSQDQYVCIDSSKFDYNVPGWFFLPFLRRDV